MVPPASRERGHRALTGVIIVKSGKRYSQIEKNDEPNKFIRARILLQKFWERLNVAKQFYPTNLHIRRA